MELKDLKTVTKIIDGKLKKQARKEQILKDLEEKELDTITTQEETQEETQEDTQNDHANNATKNYILGGAVAVLLGGALYLKLKKGNNE